MPESETYSKLEELRSELSFASIENISSITNVEINGETFEQRIWSEFYESSKLFVFLLEKKILLPKTYCIGLLVGSDGQAKNLGGEQLWDMGIPWPAINKPPIL
jgi:hypothetical protein